MDERGKLRIRSTIATGVALIAAGCLAAFSAPSVAEAATVSYGADISYPQCKSIPELDGPFAIIGVNGGKATTFNPCFSNEYASALLLSGTSEQPHAAVYLNTGNPALAGTWWPSSNKTEGGTGYPSISVTNPKGTCAHKAGGACAFVYGYSVAQADYYTVTHSDSVNSVPAAWWLDVETSNTWQSDTSANAASLAGMIYYLNAQGVTNVGLYSTAYQWKKISGVTSSTSVLAKLPTWLAGASSTSAAGDCDSLPALTPGGRVSLVQYVKDDLDLDYSCHVFAPPPTTLTGTLSVGQRVTATHAAWTTTGTTTYSYRWYHSGVLISGATSSYHTLTAADAGKTITVHVTGKQSGYKTATTVGGPSAAVDKTFTTTVVPTISGSTTVGSTLTAARGTWKPGSPTYEFQWLRDGVAISGATAKTYPTTSADAGHGISVRVTGSEKGYTPVAKTSASKSITGAA